MASPPDALQWRGAEDARRAAKDLQDHEREELRAAGRRKLNELRVCKAAAVKLLEAAKAHSQLVSRVPANVQSNTAQLGVLPEPICQPDGLAALEQASSPGTLMQARSSSDNQCAASVLLQRQLSNRNCTGSGLQESPASSLPAVASSCSEMQADAVHRAAGAGGVDAVVAGGAEPAVWQQPVPHIGASSPAQDPDPMVDMLLAQVSALMSEKQHLAARCCGLERENEQLAELVEHLSVTLDEQHALQDEQQQQSQHSCQLQLLPEYELQQCANALAKQASLAQEQQQRVADWLDHKQEVASAESQEWQEWQERLTLDPMSSGGSSLTIALDEA